MATEKKTWNEGLHEYRYQLAGRELIVEIGEMARQANGAVLVRYGDTAVLATATASPVPREGVDFFPLTVDVEERLYAVGRIPGSWPRREGRPPEKAILAARLTDRPIRPLFAEGYRNDVHIVLTPFSVDHNASPDIVGMIGASVALGISNIPFEGPIGAVEVGRVNGELVINPDREASAASDLSLVVAGTRDAVLMVEAGAQEVPEHVLIDAITVGHAAIRGLVDFQERIIGEVGLPKLVPPVVEFPEGMEPAMDQHVGAQLRTALRNPEKQSREAAIDDLQARAVADLAERFPDQEATLVKAFRNVLKREVRQMILQEGLRTDGRGLDQVREISCRVGIFSRTHGSGLFRRGQTQVLSVATLGTIRDAQELDTTGEQEQKRYMHHYNFPPYSVGEARFMRGPGRREIGHGFLAERALLPVLPLEEEFPYTLRVVSEVLESNGSTSMASVCGSTLALMDAGVPIRKPVAGIAMGLIKEAEAFAVLTDIQGIEDFLGDMDFKVAGTRDGVTALQMDMKVKGIDRAVLQEALERARSARLMILDKMMDVIDRPRPELSPFAPRIITLQIDVDKIRDVIGPGGKMINKIIAETNTKIDIESDGRVYIAAVDGEGGKRAQKMIEDLTRDVETGNVYTGKVTRIMSFGAFVEILPGKEGMVHISELAHERVPTVEDVVKIGDEVTVKVIEIDRMGRINLSIKALLPSSGPNGEGQRGQRPDCNHADRRGDRRPPRRDGGGGGPRQRY
ncbi:MAG: polyribonucleotide nucleotidyltransferase [Bacillota bacterium]